MKWEDFQVRFSLAQRDFPSGISVGKTLTIKNSILSRLELANENTWDLPEPVLDEIINAIEAEWQRMRRVK